MPFVFRSAEHAHPRDGRSRLGAYLRSEIEAHGLRAFTVGAFDNGMLTDLNRETSGHGPIRSDRHQECGRRIRAADRRHRFRAFGAEPSSSTAPTSTPP
jgi:hypothetical protein